MIVYDSGFCSKDANKVLTSGISYGTMSGYWVTLPRFGQLFDRRRIVDEQLSKMGTFWRIRFVG